MKKKRDCLCRKLPMLPGRKEYYKICVYPSRKAMTEAVAVFAKRKGFVVNPPNFEAIFLGHRPGRSQCFGRICFHADYMGAGLMAHEALHAVCFTLECLGVTPRIAFGRKNESFADAVGFYTSRFNKAGYAARELFAG